MPADAKLIPDWGEVDIAHHRERRRLVVERVLHRLQSQNPAIWLSFRDLAYDLDAATQASRLRSLRGAAGHVDSATRAKRYRQYLEALKGRRFEQNGRSQVLFLSDDPRASWNADAALARDMSIFHTEKLDDEDPEGSRIVRFFLSKCWVRASIYEEWLSSEIDFDGLNWPMRRTVADDRPVVEQMYRLLVSKKVTSVRQATHEALLSVKNIKRGDTSYASRLDRCRHLYKEVLGSGGLQVTPKKDVAHKRPF